MYYSRLNQLPAMLSSLEKVWHHCTKNEVSIKDFFSECDQIRRKLRIWSHLLKKSLMKTFIFWEVSVASVKRISGKYHTQHLLFRTYINTEFWKTWRNKKRMAQKMLVLSFPDETLRTNRSKYERIRGVFRTLSNI